jgi:hypothetical protein
LIQNTYKTCKNIETKRKLNHSSDKWGGGVWVSFFCRFGEKKVRYFSMY